MGKIPTYPLRALCNSLCKSDMTMENSHKSLTMAENCKHTENFWSPSDSLSPSHPIYISHILFFRTRCSFHKYQKHDYFIFTCAFYKSTKRQPFRNLHAVEVQKKLGYTFIRKNKFISFENSPWKNILFMEYSITLSNVSVLSFESADLIPIFHLQSIEKFTITLISLR